MHEVIINLLINAKSGWFGAKINMPNWILYTSSLHWEVFTLSSAINDVNMGESIMRKSVSVSFKHKKKRERITYTLFPFERKY